MTSTADIGPLRLAAQRLVGPPEPTAADAVRRLLAVQAQDLPGALTSIALRTAGARRDDVAAALDSGEVVRSWPMRGTLHLVAADDLPWLLGLVGDRALAGLGKRWANLGLDEAQAERARELAVAALAGGGRARRSELLAAIDAGGVDTGGQRGYHLLWYLSQTGTLCLGPTDGDAEQRFVLLDEWIPAPRRLDRDQALAELALRFFAGHGPATVADLVRWAGSTARDVRAGLAAVRDRLAVLAVDGTEYLMDPATPDRLAAARAEAEGTLLLPGFDEFVLGYGDRGAVLAPEHANRIVPGGNGVFRPTVVHAGRIVATWRWTGRGANRAVTTEPFTDVPDDVAAAVPRLAARLPVA
ncbi:winged helix DNA-binding domain-containing protein [Geodermatophilus sp. YIM 151500]|uniref:winged helix DNA-binding domain-containing protein n=1 Tax=Geodermatophilus sp. YIM 151500 TaxID=2984531 RepID=UPI0021E49729|nr:winged helix DNA-binding domain-containing protein [Geodermatophilus sp. YIM 151500]MCV2491592.1 winged helix DNA-binding domain-containing protein [Geodermatophilus sp. YIM 151500]